MRDRRGSCGIAEEHRLGRKMSPASMRGMVPVAGDVGEGADDVGEGVDDVDEVFASILGFMLREKAGSAARA